MFGAKSKRQLAENAIAKAEAAIAAALADPTTSFFLKSALRANQARDPLDAEDDAARLALLMSNRAVAVMMLATAQEEAAVPVDRGPASR